MERHTKDNTKDLIEMLENHKNWDAEFHREYYEEKPVLMRYEIRR